MKSGRRRHRGHQLHHHIIKRWVQLRHGTHRFFLLLFLHPVSLSLLLLLSWK